MNIYRRLRYFAVVAMLVPQLPLVAQTSVSLTATPPMGWNIWNHFRKQIDDASVRAQADAMVSSGMRDAGYQYINMMTHGKVSAMRLETFIQIE
ncbi:MAG: hypothetical protein ABI177_07940 [Edaphobacter sp.]